MRKTMQMRMRQLSIYFRSDRGGEFSPRGHACGSVVKRRSALYYARVRRGGMLPLMKRLQS